MDIDMFVAVFCIPLSAAVFISIVIPSGLDFRLPDTDGISDFRVLAKIIRSRFCY